MLKKKLLKKSFQLTSHKLTLHEIVEELVKAKKIDRLKAAAIMAKSHKKNEHPFTSLARGHMHVFMREMGFSSEEEITQWYAELIGVDYLKVDPLDINVESVVSVVPYAYASRLQIMPIFVDEKKVIFVTAEPFETSWVSEIAKTIKKEVILKMAPPSQIKLLLEEVYIVQKAIRDLNSESQKNKLHLKLIQDGKIDELDSLIERDKQLGLEDHENSIVRIVDWILTFARNERASDIHLEPKRGTGRIRFRIDGKLRTVYRMEQNTILRVTTRFKMLANIKIDERRRPQDGRIKRFLSDGQKMEMRISTIPTPHGEKAVLRIFDQNISCSNLDVIGLSEEDKAIWQRIIRQRQGLILVTGPTGSGKTTTLYTTINSVASDEVNVCTIEDPVEIYVDDFNQMQIKEDIGVGFPVAIKSCLRQDPDIIMVGEIRDCATGDAALQASLTGHLVFSTLHTNGALASIQRMIDLGMPPFLINSSLKGILAQRLVRKLCPHCKKKVSTPKENWPDLLPVPVEARPHFLYTAQGCKECKQTGFIGRLCVYELVEFTDELKKILHPEISLLELQEKFRGPFRPFHLSCLQKLVQGETSLEEILEVLY